MIEYLEIRDTSRARVGILDTAKSVIWNIEYYGTGDFEIYAPFTEKNRDLLQDGFYVTRENDRNVGIIDRVQIAYNAIDGRMITASGKFAKSLLSRRIIYNLNGRSITPVISSGNVEAAARALVNMCMISATDAARNVSFLELGALAGLPAVLAGQKQTSYSNLLEYTDEILQEYEYGAYIGIDRSTMQLQYNVYAGSDRSKYNTVGNKPLVFSQDFDNLTASDYVRDANAYKNTALIGGAGEGVERYMEFVTDGSAGLERRETFIDASNQSRTYKDGETDKTYTDAEYSEMLFSKAAQDMAEMIIAEGITGGIDLTNSALQLGRDFYAGDIVTVQDNTLNRYANARIIKVTEVQDDGGYTINIEFGGAA